MREIPTHPAVDRWGCRGCRRCSRRRLRLLHLRLLLLLLQRQLLNMLTLLHRSLLSLRLLEGKGLLLRLHLLSLLLHGHLLRLRLLWDGLLRLLLDCSVLYRRCCASRCLSVGSLRLGENVAIRHRTSSESYAPCAKESFKASRLFTSRKCVNGQEISHLNLVVYRSRCAELLGLCAVRRGNGLSGRRLLSDRLRGSLLCLRRLRLVRLRGHRVAIQYINVLAQEECEASSGTM